MDRKLIGRKLMSKQIRLIIAILILVEGLAILGRNPVLLAVVGVVSGSSYLMLHVLIRRKEAIKPDLQVKNLRNSD